MLFNPAQFEYLPLTFKAHNFKSMCRISRIITFLESLRQAGWFDLFESDIQALLIFDPLITLWGNFDAPYLKLLNDASLASACFYVRTCRRVRNSKKIATICDFHLPGSFLCLSTRLIHTKMSRGERGELAPWAKWHPTCFCSRVCCQLMATMFLCCTYTNQNTKNLWRPNPAWFKYYHDKSFLNHMSILF